MISIPKYRSYLDLSPTQDDEIADLKAEVEALWVAETQRPWKAESGRVEIHRIFTPRTDTIFLQLHPVTTVTTVETRSEASGSTWEALDYADEGWEVINNQLIRLGSWWTSMVRITYDGGYATDACPSDVQRALKLQAKFARERQDTEVKISSQNFEGGSGSFVKPDLHAYFAALAESYRRLV